MGCNCGSKTLPEGLSDVISNNGMIDTNRFITRLAIVIVFMIFLPIILVIIPFYVIKIILFPEFKFFKSYIKLAKGIDNIFKKKEKEEESIDYVEVNEETGEVIEPHE